MDDRYSLEGRLVSIFLRGGWEFTGRVEFSSSDKIVLSSDMGSLVVYKDNIVAAMITDETKNNKKVDAENSSKYDVVARPKIARPPSLRADFEDELDEVEFYANDLYGSIIPEDMLEGSTEGQIPVSFSISLSEMKSPRVKENKNGPTEKTSEHRGED
jgi:sRNA-binding regulator protein Hfq